MKRGTYTPKQRTVMGVVRAMWTAVLPGIGFALTAVVDQYTALDVPMWAGIVVGAVAYGVKRAIWPDGTF